MSRSATTRSPKIMANTAKPFGTPFCCSQKSCGAQSVAKNTDKRKGLMIAAAARIPATTMTNKAAVIRMTGTLETFTSILTGPPPKEFSLDVLSRFFNIFHMLISTIIAAAKNLLQTCLKA